MKVFTFNILFITLAIISKSSVQVKAKNGIKINNKICRECQKEILDFIKINNHNDCSKESWEECAKTFEDEISHCVIQAMTHVDKDKCKSLKEAKIENSTNENCLKVKECRAAKNAAKLDNENCNNCKKNKIEKNDL